MSRSAIPSKRPADAQEAAWVADEDRFVLQQAKKKAVIRAKGGRATPVDWLAVTLAIIDPDKNPVDDELEDADLEVVDPEAVFERLEDAQLLDLEKCIESYLALEKSRSNREYWSMMKTIARDKRQQSQNGHAAARGVSSVATDLDKLLGPKSLEELEKLEKQITAKLSSNESIDTDYWEHLLKSLLTYKARAKLRKVSLTIREARLDGLRKEQAANAAAFKSRLESQLGDVESKGDSASDLQQKSAAGEEERHSLDPEPLLRLSQQDKTLDSMDERDFGQKLEEDRRTVLKLGYIPHRTQSGALISSNGAEPSAKRQRVDSEDTPVQATNSAFDREVARGIGDNEELITAEESATTRKPNWAAQHKLRQPRYVARVQSGYEWNKYNQTHYDHDNLPPKVVQGYRFNIFYPDLVDKTKAPTYRIEREGGRKRGQTFAPAGEDDQCLIRFTAGPPYDDLVFRIVDREWDFSAKRERGFKSSFDKGILQLHFGFKKVYYRK